MIFSKTLTVRSLYNPDASLAEILRLTTPSVTPVTVYLRKSLESLTTVTWPVPPMTDTEVVRSDAFVGRMCA